MSESVHTIHVPNGWSPEQTWEHIARGNRVPVRAGHWVSMLVEGLRTEPLPEGGERVVGGRLVSWSGS